jgi:ribosomal protein S18 acetylase RimI-like enzyme
MELKTRPELSVHRAEDDRLEDLRALVRRISGEDPRTATAEGLRPFFDDVSRLGRAHPSSILLGYLGDEPVGLLCATAIPKLDARRGYLFIDEIYVLARHRRCGVGRAMVGEARTLCRIQRLAGLRLLTRPENATARRFYAALGFRASASLLQELAV